MAVDGMFADQTGWPLIHSSMKPNTSTSYYGTDTENDFAVNKKRLPLEWIYNSKSITYNFNSDGLRMDKETNEVDSDYMVAFGCSHTLGVGIALEDTWPYLMSKKLQLDYINLGVSGSSIKLNAINFFNMISKIEHLPKVVAFAWPSSVRYTWYSKGQFLFYLPRYTSEKTEFKHITQAYNNLLMTDVLTSDAVFYRNMIKTTCNRLGIKYCEIGLDPRCEFASAINLPVATSLIDSHIIDNVNLDTLHSFFARDVRDKTDNVIFAHIGIGTHLDAVKLLIDQL